MQSVRDALTGLFNRRYLEESLFRELRRAERRSSPVGVMMLDIDHFKTFNDTFGHEAGDALLTRMGALLRQKVRAEDIPCRYGGEEFVLIMPDMPSEVIAMRAEELCEAVANLNVVVRGQALGLITISIGIAEFPRNGNTLESVLKSADEALYQAKAQGRDRVCIAPPVAASQEPEPYTGSAPDEQV